MYLTTQALNTILDGMVNNTGVIEAQSLSNVDGKIILFAHGGTGEFGGTLSTGEGTGFIETSGKEFVNKADLKVETGEWLIDPVNITIDSTLAGTISTALGSADVTITTAGSNTPSTTSGESGTDGDITVNSAVSWTSANDLTLHADRNININTDITATDAAAKLTLEYGQGAVAANNTADYNIARGVKINLQPGYTFATMRGTGANTDWYAVINSAAALQNIESSLSGNFAIGSNLDLSGVTWTPVGNGSAAFTGKFDGLGHTVDHLTISTAIAGSDGTGLFGNVANATLKNIGVTNVNINAALSDAVGGLVGSATDSTNIKNAYSTGSVTGNNWVGGLVGLFTSNSNLSTAIIENSNSTASVTGVANVGGLAGYLGEVTTRNNSASGVVSASASAGGLFGYSFGSSINTSYASGNVTGTADKVGGLIGFSEADSITDVYAIGNVTGANMVGGLLGAIADNAGSLTNGYASGVVTGTGANVGGLIGKIAYGAPVVTTSYWDTITTGKSTSASSATGIANTAAYTQSSYTGFDFTSTGAWFMVDGYTRPFLRMEASNTITNAHELQLMSMNLAGNYTLANNINLAPSLTNNSEMWKDTAGGQTFQGSFMPVGTRTVSTSTSFSGSLDGGNNTISNLLISRPLTFSAVNNYIGLFGSTYGSTLKNINFDVANVSGRNSVGLLAGEIRNTHITNVTVAGTVTGRNQIGGLVGQSTSSDFNNVTANVTINSTGDTAGGVLGYGESTIIQNSTSAGSITSVNGTSGGLVGSLMVNSSISNSASSATVESTSVSSHHTGGLVGRLIDASSIATSHATGNVTGGTQVGGVVGGTGDPTWGSATQIMTSYATGNVSGVNSVGGFIGRADNSTLTDSYATGGTVTGTGSDTGGLVGTVENSTVTNAYSSGLTTGNTNVGGLIGNSINSTITNSFWDNQTSGQAASSGGAGATGKTTAEMKTLATFSGTTPAWGIVVDSSLGEVYPQLRWATNGLTAGSSVWVIGTAPTPTSSSSSNPTTTTVNNVVTTIVNSTTTAPVTQTTFTSPTVQPTATQTVAQTQIQTALQTLAPSTDGQTYNIVTSTNGNEPVKILSMEQIQAAMGGSQEVRVPLGNGSLVDLVNGGLNLPAGVGQEFYVVNNGNSSSSQSTNNGDDDNQKTKKN